MTDNRLIRLAEPGPMFPAAVQIEDVKITLNADGSWEGDKDAFLAKVKDLKVAGDAYTMPLLWLVVREIIRHK